MMFSLLLRSIVRSASVRVALGVIFCTCLSVPSFAQQNRPVLSLSIPNIGENGAPKNGATKVGNNTLVLEERARTYISGNNQLQSGSIRISRSSSGTQGALIIGYSLQYFNAANASFNFLPTPTFNRANLTALPNTSNEIRQLPVPLPVGIVATPSFPDPKPVAINGLQGDLNPTYFNAILNAATDIQPNVVVMDSGATSILLNFTARFSDQTCCFEAGLQGTRLAVLRIFPLATENPPSFQVESGADSAFVLLNESPNAAPNLANRISDQFILTPIGINPTSGAIDLESPGWRPDNVPGSIFYDDNYDRLIYTAQSSDPSIVNVRVVANSSIAQGRALLVYSIPPGARSGITIPITLVATESRSNPSSATTIFNITTVNTLPTTVAASNDIQSVIIAPNPASSSVIIQGKAEHTGIVTIRLVNSAGAVVLAERITVSEGATYYRNVDIQHLPPGMYIVEAEENNQKTTRKLLKQ